MTRPSNLGACALLLAMAACQAPPPPENLQEVELVLDVMPWVQCVAAVRGELGSLDGVYDVHIRTNIRDFSVRYEPGKVGVDDMLASLEKIGEPAKRK